MTQDIPVFDRDSLGEISIRLQGCCDACPLAPTCAPSSRCPIREAGRLIGRYLSDGQQVLRPEQLSSKTVALPGGARVDGEEARRVLLQVQGLCNRCMFHVEPCAMNELYALLEIAMERAPRKLPTVKPSNDEL